MVTKDYIIPQLGGRLGNQMFEIAHAYAKGIKYNKQVVVEKRHLIYEGNDYSQNIFRKLDLIDFYDNNQNYNPNIPSDDKHSIYGGYFQNEKYFDKYSENIKTLFGPPLEFINKIRIEIPFIFEKEVTGISVRRGDYLLLPDYHPTVSKEYLQEAIKHVPNNFYIVSSDDISWCKDNLDLSNVLYLENYKTYEKLWILSMCHNFIISNSSFSWWAAYLSRAKNKKVIAPQTWFGPKGPPVWNEIYCKGWTILPTFFNKGLILPK